MKKTVLIVEDNELNMKLFNDLLEAVSYTHLDVYKRQTYHCSIKSGTGQFRRWSEEAVNILEAVRDGKKYDLKIDV